MFTLKLKSTEVQLKWGTYAMKLFCDKRGVGIGEFFTILGGVTSGLSSPEFAEVVIGMVQAGYLYANKAEVTEETVCEWFDELGGLIKVTKEGGIVDYVNYIAAVTLNGVSPLPGDLNEDKKKR